MSVQDVVAAGPLLLAMPVAVAAGVVSFASPCMLPLVPGYLSYLAGLTGSALEQAGTAPAALPNTTAAAAAAADGLGVSAAGRRGGGQAAVLEHTAPEVAVSTSAARRRARAPRTDRRVPLGAALFVLGFTDVFVAYGSAFGALGTVLRHHERAVEQTLGTFTVVLGLAFAGVLHRLPWASRQWRPPRRAAPGLLGAPMLGVLFAVSWTPCIGPTLAAVQALALTSASAGRGAVLSAAYFPRPRDPVRRRRRRLRPAPRHERLAARSPTHPQRHDRRRGPARRHRPAGTHRRVEFSGPRPAVAVARLEQLTPVTATAQAFTSAPADLDEHPELPGASRRRPLARLLRTWRQLTSMRTALQLLFLLAVAAVPGSVLPQRGVSPIRVQQFLAAHRRLGPFLDRLDGFDVFAAPWFAAVYALLMISLIGYLVPRIRLHARAAVRRPPTAPRHPSRLSTGTSWVCDLPVEVVLAQARTVLRRRRFRTTADGSSVAAEKGYLRETGNLAFHVALGLLLVGVALGSLRGYSGTVLVVEGKSFSNTVVDYDQFKPGALLDTARLQPFTFALDRFSAAYRSEGTPTYFGAHVSYQSTPTGPARRQLIQVNHPLRLGETKVYLIGHGYAPHVVLRDRTGAVVYDDAPPCDPTASVELDSTCVVKIPDTGLPPAGPRRIPQQLALYGPLTPTPPPDGSPLSTSPQLTNPVLRLQVLLGDLHLDGWC